MVRDHLVLMAADDAFYVSGTFWLTAVSVALTVILVGFGYWAFRAERRDRAVIHWRQDIAPILQPDERLNEGLRIFWNEDGIRHPTLVSVYITNVGRTDIGTNAFDAHHPIVIRFNAPVVALIEPTRLNVYDEILPIQQANDAVRIGPGLLKRDADLKVVALTDGSTGAEITFPLASVTIQEATPVQSAAYAGRTRAFRATALAAIASAAVAGAVVLLTTIRPRPADIESTLAKFVAPDNCDPFQVYAQNQWDPVGTDEHLRPTTSSAVVRSYPPNSIIGVDGWVHGSADFQALAKPFNGDIWFHVQDGSGWVPTAGVRSATTNKPVVASPNGGPAVLSTANCQGKVQ